MKKIMKQVFIGVMAAVLVVEGFSPATTKAVTTSSKVSIGSYIKEMVKVSGITVNEADSDPYVKAAMENGIIKEAEFASYSASITNEQAAVLAERTDEKLHGTDYNGDLVAEIKKKKRIADLSKADPTAKEDIVKVFSKGIMVGESRGKYTHSRVFNPKGTLTSKEANVIYARLAMPSKRKRLSPDGQVIRTTKLPKNYKSYDYILEAFPNSFYEMKFEYQRSKYYYKPVELIDYANPKRFKDIKFHGEDMQGVLDQYKDTWMQRVETNLTQRLNVNYRTIDNKWLNTLRSAYTQYGGGTSDKEITDDIKAYIKVLKKNKIVVKSQVVSVEPSTLYKTSSYYVRAYVKFKVTYSGNRLTAEDLICGDYIWLPELKKDTWFEGVYDIEIGTVNGSSNGSDYYVTNDSLIDFDN